MAEQTGYWIVWRDGRMQRVDRKPWGRAVILEKMHRTGGGWCVERETFERQLAMVCGESGELEERHWFVEKKRHG